MNVENNPNQPPPQGGTVSILAASVISLACATGCSSAPYPSGPETISKNAQLAISPNGSRLLVSWYDGSEKLYAKLVELEGAKVASVRDVRLPSGTLSTAFSSSNDSVLVTTKHEKTSDLVKVNLKGDVPTVIYKSRFVMRFPMEVEEGNYVFLEGIDPESLLSRWFRYKQNEKTSLNEKTYRLAADLDKVGDSLFIFEPSQVFQAIHGPLPAGLDSVVSKSTFSVNCADTNPVSCVRTHLFYGPDGKTFSTVDILNGKNRCEISGKWIDGRDFSISRDGGTVVFHAADQGFDGPRKIYVVKNDVKTCVSTEINLKGEK